MGSVQSDPAEALHARVSEAETEIQSLCSEIMERYEECALVYRLCERMGTVLGEDAIAGTVLEEVARVLQADHGEAWLLRDEGIACVARLEGGPPEPGLPEALRQATLDEGRPWLTEPGEEPELAVAIPDPEGRALGLLRLRGRAGERMYGTGETKLVSALATLTSSFIRLDRMAEEVRLAEARRRELELTRQIHQGLLPASGPSFPGIDVAASCQAAENIGGDYYDYLDFDDGGLGFAGRRCVRPRRGSGAVHGGGQGRFSRRVAARDRRGDPALRGQRHPLPRLLPGEPVRHGAGRPR